MVEMCYKITISN